VLRPVASKQTPSSIGTSILVSRTVLLPLRRRVLRRGPGGYPLGDDFVVAVLVPDDNADDLEEPLFLSPRSSSMDRVPYVLSSSRNSSRRSRAPRQDAVIYKGELPSMLPKNEMNCLNRRRHHGRLSCWKRSRVLDGGAGRGRCRMSAAGGLLKTQVAEANPDGAKILVLAVDLLQMSPAAEVYIEVEERSDMERTSSSIHAT